MEIELKKNCSLKEFSYFKIGGIAENIYFPKTQDELIFLLKTLDTFLIFGGCSNVLFSSSKVAKNIIITTKMDTFDINENSVNAMCGVRGAVLSRACMEKSLSGIEFMSGFPGSIGGNVFMNASAHSQSVSDCLKSVKVFDLETKSVLCLDKDEMSFNYRTSILQKSPLILLSAQFVLVKDDKSKIQAKILENKELRKSHQPQGLSNAGSIFKNPKDNSAGKLLEQVGAKNFKIGGAEVFENHANFIVNIDNATSQDVLELMFKMYNEVKKKFNIELKPEVKFFGEKTIREEEICKILFQK